MNEKYCLLSELVNTIADRVVSEYALTPDHSFRWNFVDSFVSTPAIGTVRKCAKQSAVLEVLKLVNAGQIVARGPTFGSFAPPVSITEFDRCMIRRDEAEAVLRDIFGEPVLLTSVQSSAPLIPTPVADSASNAPAMNPPPVATGDIAHAFDGLRGWNEKAWKNTLGSPPKWLEACIALRGERGKREHHWNPVFIGAALVHNAHARANNIRARFQTRPQLSAWLEAWKTYEADNFDTQ